MFRHLAPVGYPVSHNGCRGDIAQFHDTIAPYQAHFYQSGTAALAAAIVAAHDARPDIPQAEVIMPAYACPDLISAAVYAGVKPVLIDLEDERPWLDLEQLAAAITDNTIAVVAVNFLGIKERFDRIRSTLADRPVVLIEDSAQAFPRQDEEGFWQGDLVVLSFGRGKPLSLLGGGALLFKPHYQQWLPRVEPAHKTLAGTFKYHLKTVLYNFLIRPGLYWIPEAMPGLNLGETRYHPLNTLVAISQENLSNLPCNLTAYQQRTLTTEQALHAGFSDISGIVDLPSVTDTPDERALLRYPILVPASVKASVYAALKKAGLGASQLYPSALPSIPGVDKMPEITGEFPRAESFSERLITLPTHAFVKQEDLLRIFTIIGQTI